MSKVTHPLGDITTPTRNPEATNLALQGEVLRNQGDFSSAINSFDQAIGKDGGSSWAYAHRGACKAALQDLAGALADFNRAFELRPNYPWACAQKGEAYRLYAWDHLWANPNAGLGGPDSLVDPLGDDIPTHGRGTTHVHVNLQTWLQLAVEGFDEAIRSQPNNAWAYAHRGAAYTLRYFVKRYVYREPADDFAKNGLADFDKARELNPAYSWASAFRAMLLTLMDRPDDARAALADSLLYDVNHRVAILRPLSMLYNYSHDYKASLTAAWQALQVDPEDYIARYFATVGMAKSGSIDSDSVQAAIDKTARHLMNVKTRVTALLGGLALLNGRREIAIDSLKEVQANPDVETCAIVNLDTTWESLRNDPATASYFQPPGSPASPHAMRPAGRLLQSSASAAAATPSHSVVHNAAPVPEARRVAPHSRKRNTK